MKIYKILRPQHIKVFELDIPEIKNDEVLVKVAHIGICGSDVQLYEGTYEAPFNYPISFGHEWSGKVIRTGKDVFSIFKNDKVTGDCSRFCGKCAFCHEDKNLCMNIEKFGITIDGASSEYIVRKEKYLYRSPDDIELPLLTLAEPLSVSAHLINKIERCIGPIKNKKVLIFGAGTIGLGLLLLLKHFYDVKRVEIFDLSKGRLLIAKKLGAEMPPDEFFIQKEKKIEYKDLYMSDYDIVLESTGSAEIFSRSLEVVKPLGVIGCLGMNQKAVIQQKLIVTKALKIIGSIGGTGEFPWIIDFIHKNIEILNNIVSHRIPIDQADKAFSISKDKEISIKIVLDM